MPWGLDPDHTKPGQERVLVVSEPDTLFTWTGGKSGFGKSETTMARFLYLARAGHGCLFLDPHSDSVNKLKPYLGPVADRVAEIALDSSQPEQIAAWNPFDLPSEWSPDCDVTPAEWRTQMGAAEALIHDTYFGFSAVARDERNKSWTDFQQGCLGAVARFPSPVPREPSHAFLGYRHARPGRPQRATRGGDPHDPLKGPRLLGPQVC